VYLLMRTAQWLFFLNIVVLFISNELVKGVVATVTAPVILVAGLVLLVNWRGAISEFRGELEARNYALARMVSGWRDYFWRTVGVSIMIVGATVLAFGIAGLAG
jgi:hypothetical protein